MEQILFLSQNDYTTKDILDGAAILSSGENEAISRIRMDHKRELHLLTHTVLRKAAAAHLSLNPGDLIYSTGPLGKPLFTNAPELFFSISYTDNASVIALSDRPVGIDVEKIRPHHMKFVKRLGTASELSRLKAAPDDLVLFYEFWTRKEAWVKYTGTGLHTPLSSFDVWDGDIAGRLTTWQENGCMITLCL